MATTKKQPSRRRGRALYHFAEQMGDEVQNALDAAKSRQLAPAEMVLQWAAYLHARYTTGASTGALPKTLLRKPAGLTVSADLAAELKAIDPHLLEACIKQLRAAMDLARPFDGKPFARKVIGRRVGTSATPNKVAIDEEQALERLEQAGADLIEVFRRALAELESETTTATDRPRSDSTAKHASTLTPPKLAKEWGVDVDKIYAFIRSGELLATDTAIKRGGRPRYRINRQDAEDFQRRRQNAPPPPRSPRRKKADASVKRYY